MNLSMNTTMTTLAPTGVPAIAGAALLPDAAAPAIDPLLAGALPATPAVVLPFQQWIGLDPALAGADTDIGTDPELAAAPSPEAANDAQALDAAPASEQPVDAMLLGAMSAPLLAANLPSAMPAMMMAMNGAKLDNRAPALERDIQAAPAPLSTSGAAPTPVAPTPARAAVDPVALPAVTAAPATAVRADVAASVQAPSATVNKTATASPVVDATAADSAAVDAPAAPALAAATTPASTTRATDSVALSGPPTAWRQTLQEALGDRLQLQAGRGIEQATIRLEPPMLGRIDIAIRHSGGNLEVHIAASNSEVMRQLSGVSDALRNDLANRQFSSVSVSVGETPRTQAGAQAGNHPGQGNQNGQPGADAQGRGRQPGQEARTPGLALNDAGDAGSLFSMNGRD